MPSPMETDLKIRDIRIGWLRQKAEQYEELVSALADLGYAAEEHDDLIALLLGEVAKRG